MVRETGEVSDFNLKLGGLYATHKIKRLYCAVEGHFGELPVEVTYRPGLCLMEAIMSKLPTERRLSAIASVWSAPDTRTYQSIQGADSSGLTTTVSVTPSPILANIKPSRSHLPLSTTIGINQVVNIGHYYDHASGLSTVSAQGESHSTVEAGEMFMDLIGIPIKRQEATLAQIQKLRDTWPLRQAAFQKLNSQVELQAQLKAKGNSIELSSNDYYFLAEERSSLYTPSLPVSARSTDPSLLRSAKTKLQRQAARSKEAASRRAKGKGEAEADGGAIQGQQGSGREKHGQYDLSEDEQAAMFMKPAFSAEITILPGGPPLINELLDRTSSTRSQLVRRTLKMGDIFSAERSEENMNRLISRFGSCGEMPVEAAYRTDLTVTELAMGH